MYEELVKRLREAPNDWPDAGLHYEAADTIEELEKKMLNWQAKADDHWEAYQHWFHKYMDDMPKWIPVTERLPEKRRWVLCWCVSNSPEVLRWENNEWYHDPQHIYFDDFVTHWMPLPEPPKEE